MKKLEWIYMVSGTFLVSLAFSCFFIPNEIAPGGVSGFATLINVLFGFPVGLGVIICNIPIFILAWRKHGTKFMVYSLVSTILLSIFIEVLIMPEVWIDAIKADLLLSTVIGGAIAGVGIGLVFKAGVTTGGTDMLAKVIHDWFPNITIAWVLFAIDFLVVFSAAIFISPLAGLYALVALFIMSNVIDFVQTGIDSAKAFTIISDQSDEIAHKILHELNRGVTFLSGHGGYTKNPKDILMCVVRRNQISRVRNIVKSVDENAFVIIHDVKEVMGEGFGR